jgi:hypothetical protein
MELRGRTVEVTGIHHGKKRSQIKHFAINTHSVSIAQTFAFLNLHRRG